MYCNIRVYGNGLLSIEAVNFSISSEEICSTAVVYDGVAQVIRRLILLSSAIYLPLKDSSDVLDWV